MNKSAPVAKIVAIVDAVSSSSAPKSSYVEINWEAIYALSRIEGEHLYTLVWFLIGVILFGSCICVCFWCRVWRVTSTSVVVPTPSEISKELRTLLPSSLKSPQSRNGRHL
jgi:hypothetical protein